MATTTHFANLSSDAIAMQKLRNLYNGHRPDIKIRFNRERTTYTTLDQLDGVVTITSTSDIPFDDVEVEFVGTSRTFVERLTTAAAISGRSEAFHQFLKLQQPDLASHYPEDRIFKAGETYEFPFVFVIPQQLLPRVCQHKAVSPAVRDAHLQLPPTFGDKEDEEREIADDMVPEMASIRYGVFARVSRTKEDTDGETTRTTIGSKAKRLRVIPAHDEQPPLDVEGKDSEYTLRKERLIRKGVLKGKLGTLVMDANQPPSMVLESHPSSTGPSTSKAIVQLRFDPADSSCPPPRIGSLATKLKVCTYFASTARHTFPTKTKAITDLSQGMHSEQINLSSRCMANVEWTRHDPTKPLSRRDSGLSIASSNLPHPEPSSTYKAGSAYYIARLTVPLALPTNKTFVPTFHSCLVSRIYQLKFELGLQTAGLGGTLDLKVPFQLSCEATSDGYASPRRGSVVSPTATPEHESVDAYFAPRDVTNGPAPAYGAFDTMEAEDAPPGYSFAPARAVGMTLPVY